jgi:hypothetical protein
MGGYVFYTKHKYQKQNRRCAVREEFEAGDEVELKRTL